MKLKQGTEQEYEAYKLKNSTDPYSARVVSYSEDWANLMEAHISAGEKLEDIAQQTSREADTDGITGFMYGCSVSALSHFWEHGEQLRRWHNIDVAPEGQGAQANETGGVLNPAIITIS